MQIPGHYLRRPAAWQASDVTDFERLFADQVSSGTGAPVHYQLSAPKWQFLCWMTEFNDVVLHGANGSTIDTLEPRQAHDVNEFGGYNAVYAASDGIWPMYFAIANRTVVTSLVNACVHLDDAEVDADRYYYFSIDADPELGQAWVAGSVYMLAAETFVPEEEDSWHGRQALPTQWVSQVPVRPMASLAVTPADFPFIKHVRTHDPQVVAERAAKAPDNFPWLSET